MLAVVWVAAALVALAGCGATTAKLIVVTPSPDPAVQVMTVKEGILTILLGVHKYAVDNQDTYPDSSLVNASGLADYVSQWPTNPYTGQPMSQGTGPGDFTYAVSNNALKLVGYGTGGEGVITVP